MITDTGESNVFEYSVCMHQGQRKSMEDTFSVHTLHTHLNGKDMTRYLFGVHDGHHTDAISLFCRNYIPILTFNKYYVQGDIPKAIVNTFEYIDTLVTEKLQVESKDSGCVSAIVLIDPYMQQLIIGCIGDCRVIGKKYNMVKQLTEEHRLPNKERLYHRAANFSLNVTRALGDHDFKTTDSSLSCIPDVYTYLTLGYSLIVIMTDGIHDYITNDLLMAFICERLSNKPLKRIAQDVIEYIRHKQGMSGIHDNMTLIIIKFK